MSISLFATWAILTNSSFHISGEVLRYGKGTFEEGGFLQHDFLVDWLA